jgi:PD-(D/E)XK nuclease superfamily protein
MGLEPDGHLSLSSTSVVAALKCLKAWDYRHNLHLVARPDRVSIPLRKGIWLHACLEEIHRGRGWGHTLTQMADWATDHGVAQEQVDKISSEVVRIINGYLDYWKANERYSLTPIAAELPLSYALPSGDVLTATIDTLVEYRGEKYILEHKSTQRFPDANWRTADPQTAIQYLLCKLNGIDVAGVTFNYLSTAEPPIPQATKGSKNVDPRFYATEITTTTSQFLKGAEDLGGVWRGTQDEFVTYVASQKDRMVNDDKFYLRETVYKPDRVMAEVLGDVRWAYEAIRLAEKFHHYPRSAEPTANGHCSYCTYSQLCTTELARGGEASLLREQEFMIETPDLRSEGRVRV